MATVQQNEVRRKLVKLTGEVLCTKENRPFDKDQLAYIINEIGQATIASRGLVHAIYMFGGGNHLRGSRMIHTFGLTGRVAHHNGMLYAIVNNNTAGDLLEQWFKREGVPMKVRVCLTLECRKVGETYFPKKVVNQANEGDVQFIAGGRGIPFFTTDGAAINIAAELGCDEVLKGTKVDGVFDKDPLVHFDAKKFASISYKDFAQRDLTVFDPPAVSDAAWQKIPIKVFNIFEPGNLRRALLGESIGSVISSGETIQVSTN